MSASDNYCLRNPVVNLFLICVLKLGTFFYVTSVHGIENYVLRDTSVVQH